MECTDIAPVTLNFLVTSLILWVKPQLFGMNLKLAVPADEPFGVGVWRLDETAHSGPFMRNTAKAPVEPSGTRRLAF